MTGRGDRRAFALAGLMLLAACHAAPTGDNAAAPAPVASATPADDRIPCAKGNAPLAPACTVTQEQAPRGLLLTLTHPDGSFRRLLVTTDGRGVVAADGAQPVRVAVAGADAIDVSVGGERYRLPATVGKRR